MKKIGILLLALFALTGTIHAQDLKEQEQKEAMKILEKTRNRILEEEKARQKALEEAKRVEAEKIEAERAEQEKVLAESSNKENNTVAVINVTPEEVKKEEKKQMTPFEKLQATRKEAMEHLDFYERVVRSVAREEAEVKGYQEVMNLDEKK